MVLVANKEQNESYTFKDMLLQPENSYLIIAMTKEVEAHEDRSNRTLMKNIEVNNKYKNKYGQLKTILSIWNFKRKRLPDVI